MIEYFFVFIHQEVDIIQVLYIQTFVKSLCLYFVWIFYLRMYTACTLYTLLFVLVQYITISIIFITLYIIINILTILLTLKTIEYRLLVYNILTGQYTNYSVVLSLY